MPYDDPDPTDPMTLHAQEFETDSAAIHDMAECFVEEYVRLGMSPDLVLQMFRTQGYAGPFLAYRVLGEEAIWALIDEIVQRWGGRAPGLGLDRMANGDVSLPVL